MPDAPCTSSRRAVAAPVFTDGGVRIGLFSPLTMHFLNGVALTGPDTDKFHLYKGDKRHRHRLAQPIGRVIGAQPIFSSFSAHPAAPSGRGCAVRFVHKVRIGVSRRRVTSAYISVFNTFAASITIRQRSTAVGVRWYLRKSSCPGVSNGVRRQS